MTANVNGLDVAAYQPKTFSTAGKGFIFVKATEGTGYTNPDYAAQLSTSRKGHCVTGHYLFLHPGNVAAQVNYFVTRADIRKGEVIAVDWESENGAWPSNADKDLCIKTLKGKYPGNRVGLYTNVDGWKTHDHTSYCGDFLWIADPGQKAPRIQHPWTFWQTGYTKIDGVQFDADVANFATLDELKTWAGFPATVPDTPTTRPQAYKDVVLSDVVPVPAGHDGGGNQFWTLQTLLLSMYAQVQENNDMLKRIIAEIEADHSPEVPNA